MHTHAIFLPVKVSDAKLRQFVESRGGDWQQDSSGVQGVWDGGPKAYFFLRPLPEDWRLDDGDPAQLARVEQILGRPVKQVMAIDRSRKPEAAAIARPVIDAIVAEWGGHEIDCGG